MGKSKIPPSQEDVMWLDGERFSWDEYFMGFATLATTRSSCIYFHTGAVIVKDKRAIATGYNGASPNIKNCLERGCRKREKSISFEKKGTGECRGTHAERNVMLQIARQDLKGTKLYTLYYPCSTCAKDIVSGGITEVVYSFIYKEPDSLTKELFLESGIALTQFTLKYERLEQVIKKILIQQKI